MNAAATPTPLPTRQPGAWARAPFLALLAAVLALAMSACSTSPPPGAIAVTPFDVQRYAGKWYEVARLDHSFERGLSDVSATYQLQPDGSVQVINRGYDPARKAWKEAIGRARFLGDSKVGSLEVSFFGPFYGGYHVVALDEKNYRWAMVIGPDTDYLWILSRDATLPPGVRERLLVQARQLDVNTDALIWVAQTRSDR